MGARISKYDAAYWRSTPRSWLYKQNKTNQIWYGARCALRGLPVLGYLYWEGQLEKSFDSVTLPCLHSVLVSAVSSQEQDSKLKLLAGKAEFAAKQCKAKLELAEGVTKAFVRVAPDAALAVSPETSTFLHALGTRGHNGAFGRIARNTILEADKADTALPGSWGPLYRAWPLSGDIDQIVTRLSSAFGCHPDKWSFWDDWFTGFLIGKPMDWEIQLRVALISNFIWEAGPTIVANKIEAIRAKFDLEKRIEDLETERDSLVALTTRHGIGGNYPPEDMQIEPQVVRETTIIWAAVDELKAETEKEAPDKSTVLRIVETLGRVLKAILAWCAQKGDLSVDTLIKWGIPIGGAAVLANPKLVADVIEAAKVWVPFLP